MEEQHRFDQTLQQIHHQIETLNVS